MKELTTKVIAWAHERGIFDPENGSSAIVQTSKLMEEVIELRDELLKFDLEECAWVVNGARSRLIELELGDCLVVLTLIAEFQDTTLEECLVAAYSKIKDRKGKMVCGKFVKEGD